MPVKIHLTEEAMEGFELAQTQGYYGVKLLVRPMVHMPSGIARQESNTAEIVLFTLPSTFMYLFDRGLTQIKIIIIRCKCFFLFIGEEPTT